MCIRDSLYTMLVLSNSFTGCMFAINSDQGYVRGGCIFLTYLIFYAYCIACIVVAVRNLSLIHICNSYSKTDMEATFMRMKEECDKKRLLLEIFQYRLITLVSQ